MSTVSRDTSERIFNDSTEFCTAEVLVRKVLGEATLWKS